MLPDGRRYRAVPNAPDLITAYQAGTIPRIPEGIVALIDAREGANDAVRVIAERLKAAERRSWLVLNKTDLVAPASLLPLTATLTALEALYGHYEKTFELWNERRIRVPPCFIVVCNNTSASKLVYDYISGFKRPN